MKGIFGIVAAILLVIGIIFCTYTVKEWEQAVVLKFGKYQRVVNPHSLGDNTNAGLKFKAPWENVIPMERRKIALDIVNRGQNNDGSLLDKDKKPLEVDGYILYEITDPLAYYQALGDRETANARLERLTDSALRNVIANVQATDVISGQRSVLMNEIKDVVNKTLLGKGSDSDGRIFGVIITDVRIRKVELPSDVAESVFERMKSDFNQIAQLETSTGEKRKNEIIATADRDATITVAEAEGRAQTIRGEGDAQSNAIYAEAYGVDPEFFAFYRTMESYRRGIKNGTSYVLSPDSDFLSYLDKQNPTRRRN